MFWIVTVAFLHWIWEMMSSETSNNTIPAKEPKKFSWVVDGVLAASGFPDEAGNLEFLVNNNVGCIVSLTDERQVDRQGITEDQLKIVWISVADYGVPSLEQVNEFIDCVMETQKSGKATLVHCAMGKGRTGTMLSCYFVKIHQMSAEQAIAHVRQLRPGSVENESQEKFVKQFEQSIRR